MRKFLRPTPSKRRSSTIRRFSLIEQLESRQLLSAAPIYDSETYLSVPAAATDAAPTSITNGELKEVAVNLGGIAYFVPFWVFADALKMEDRGFMYYSAKDTNNISVEATKLDSRGYVIPAGTYNAKPFQNSYHPTGAPQGRYVVTWEGTGTVTLRAGTNGSALTPIETGPNRNVYIINNGRVNIQVDNVATGGDYVRNVHAWMPDPSDPMNKSLEPSASNPDPFWHPQYIEHLEEISAHAGYFRYMDWLNTNASPEVNWSDSRPADHAFANGKTNWKTLNVPGVNDTTFYGDIGVAWEWIIDLSNRMNVNPWINIPHAATDDYVRHVADMFAGKTPGITGLNPGLKVYVEYSNEIWSNGRGFAQGDWAQQQASSQGISKPKFNGRRSTEIFRIFDQSFRDAGPSGGIDRSADVVRVAAAFANQLGYNTEYLNGMKDRADDWVGEPNYMGHVFATTTYFGGDKFVQYAFNETDWLNVDYNDPNDPVIQAAIDAWITQFSLTTTNFTTSQSRILSDQYGLKFLTYEGGPSLYTHGVFVYIKDGKIVSYDTPGATRNYSLAEYVKQNFPDDDTITSNPDRFTKFLIAINQNPRMKDVYAATLQVFKARGLKTHSAFNDFSGWSRTGQWGHKEYLGQTSGYNYGDAVKWQYLLDYAIEEEQVREVDDPINNVPQLPPISTIGSTFTGQYFSYDINALSLGDYTTSADIKWNLVAGFVPAGMSLTRIDDDTMRLAGTPLKGGLHKIMVRLMDADNDPAYSIFTLNVLGGTVAADGIQVYADSYGTPGDSSTETTQGSEPEIIAGNGAQTAYVKFDLRNIVAGDIQSAKFRFYIQGYQDDASPSTSPTAGRITGYLASDNLSKLDPDDPTVPWDDSNLSSALAPTRTSTALGSVFLTANPAGWVELDATNVIKNNIGTDGFISFALVGIVAGGDQADYGILIASSEHDGGDLAPRIIVTQSSTAVEPLVADISPIVPNPRTTPVGTAVVTFNKSVTGFDASDIILIRNGQTLTLSGVTISTTNNTTFTISGLTGFTGTSGGYSISLKVAGSGIRAFADVNDTFQLTDTETWSMTATTVVTARKIFYNNSVFDNSDEQGNVADDQAIATDKVALRPGQGTANFSNYTNYSRGINGVMIDLANLPFGTLTEEDLGFRIGNVASPGSMTTFDVMPDITIRRGVGINGADRITLIWPDGLIRNTWLEVTVKSTNNTGLASPDVFYFGNQIGETGETVRPGTVDSSDVTRVRANLTPRGTSALVNNIFDLDRDGKVDSFDVTVVRSSLTARGAELKMIVV